MQKKREQENQNRTETAKDRNFVYLVTFRKLGFRQSNIFCIGILSFLIVQTDYLLVIIIAMSQCAFLSFVANKNSCFFMVKRKYNLTSLLSAVLT